MLTVISRLPREMVASTISLDIFHVPLHWRRGPYVCILGIDHDYGRDRVFTKVYVGPLIIACCILKLLQNKTFLLSRSY